MSESGNVRLSSVNELGQGLDSFAQNLGLCNDEATRIGRQCINEFNQKLSLLRRKTQEAEHRLRLEEAKLQTLQMMRIPVYDSEGNLRGYRTPDCSVQRAKVAMAEREVARFRTYETRCSSIISTCQREGSLVGGIYRMMNSSLQQSKTELCEIRGLIEDHLNVPINGGTSSMFEAGNAANSSCGFTAKEKTIRHSFYTDSGISLTDAKITIVDNSLFGFGRIDVQTDKDGNITIPWCETQDCSIFINGKEVYSGKLNDNMVYNKNRDGKYNIGDINDNQRKEG